MERKTGNAESPGAVRVRAAGPARSILRYLALTGLLALVGYLPTRAVAGRPGTIAMAVGLALVLAAWGFGQVAAWLVGRSRPANDAGPILTRLAVRFILTIALLVAAVLATRKLMVPQGADRAIVALAVWTIIGYLSFVMVEVLPAGLHGRAISAAGDAGQVR